MKKELTEKLCNDFPLLYADRRKSPKETMMCFGFECGDGWFDLIYNLSNKLEAEIKRTRPNIIFRGAQWLFYYFRRLFHIGHPFPPFYPRAVQVKEKFGGLRFYMTSETTEMSDFIRVAENISYKTCEICGKDGEPSEAGWITTLCENCRGHKT